MSGGDDAQEDGSGNAPQIEQTLPPIAALFLIKFDLKVGYTIAWKRSVDGVDLDGTVEYKSLPSGLHAVKEDLVYFIHESHAGVSAFINGPADKEHRNAHLVAVGILIPLSVGRLGRGWLHAEKLRELAGTLVQDVTKTEPLESYWRDHATSDGTPDVAEASAPKHVSEADRPQPVPIAPQCEQPRKPRGLSTASASPEQSLPSTHPVLSIFRFIDTFGPLVFPLYRAALLRKRILFVSPPPVRSSCEYVYDLSILSTLHSSTIEDLPVQADTLRSLRPFFSLGIHDIPLLETEATRLHERNTSLNNGDTPPEIGWIACTTDEVLCTKTKLYDVIIEMPHLYDDRLAQRKWPKICTSSGASVLATQRDLRRYQLLQRQMQRFNPLQHEQDQPYRDDAEHDHAPLLPSRTEPFESTTDDTPTDDLIEPSSWMALAYKGFMWWASAGEKDAALASEEDFDRAAMADIGDAADANMIAMQNQTSNHDAEEQMQQSWFAGGAGPNDDAAKGSTAVIAYFHRLTSTMFETLGDLLNGDGEEGARQGKVIIDGGDLSQMGLDQWSESDLAFVRELIRLYWGGREGEVEVRGASVECCGVKIC